MSMINRSIHNEYEYTNKNENVIVFIHGILGSPDQLRFLAEALFKRSFDCVTLLLPGHGGTSKSFYSTPGKMWEEYINHTVEKLKRKYKRIFLVGHSLGGLLCLNCAAKNEISGIILINTPIKFKLTYQQVAFSLRILFTSKDEDNAFLSAYRNGYSIGASKFYEYPLWLRQFFSLYKYARSSAKILETIKTKVLIVQSDRDESVHRKSSKMLILGLKKSVCTFIRLEDSFHGYFPENDKLKLTDEIFKFITC